MAQSYLIFNFQTNEEAAQQARHRVDGWKQGFRLGNKLQIKFDRGDSEKNKDVRVLVRLDFSDHEKLSHQRWLDRIPGEEPFKAAQPQVVRAGDPAYQSTADLFESLD